MQQTIAILTRYASTTRMKKKTYRFKPGKEDQKEYCQSMDKGTDTDEMVATWADGKTWAVPGLSSASYAASLTGRTIQ